MVFAFRIVDCFFCMGPKVLFQVGWVILISDLSDFVRSWWLFSLGLCFSAYVLVWSHSHFSHLENQGRAVATSTRRQRGFKVCDFCRVTCLNQSQEGSSLIRDYFASLDNSAHPNSSDACVRTITRFQELLLVSFRDFSVITYDLILSDRKRFRHEIIHSIETFSKRSAVRNLRSLARFSKDQVRLIYDALYQVMCHPASSRAVDRWLVTVID